MPLQNFTSLLDTSSSVKEMHIGDYGITNETIGIPAEAVQALQAQEAVEELNTVKLSVFHESAGDVLPFETNLSVQSHETLQAWTGNACCPMPQVCRDRTGRLWRRERAV